MYTYVPPILTVDAVILAIIKGKLSVLLHQRPKEPFKGQWALPGAYCSRDQSTAEALEERVRSKMDVNFTTLPYFEQLYVFDTKGRDPRGPTISVTYLGVTRQGDYTLNTAENSCNFFAITDLPELAFDHADIIKVAVKRLSSKLLYTDIIKYILPHEFTLTELQDAYQQITGTEFDKRNFRKRFLNLDVITPSQKKTTGAAHRPAQLYEFKKQQGLEELTRAF